MKFTSARMIEQIVWQMRLNDYPRSRNRALIDDLANGAPPIPADQAAENGIEVNVNDLSMTRLTHDARLQLYQAFTKPGNYFTARTDMGAADRRTERGLIVTKEANRLLKRSRRYPQIMRSKFAMMVLHGLGPSVWENPDRWCPTAVELGDVLVPSRTLLTFENLPFFAVWRAFTAEELIRLTRPDQPNPGWNMPVVHRAIEWAEKETAKLYAGQTWQEYWVPEKRASRMKSDSGVYASDMVQTIDCWDFYYWDDAKNHEGWRRKIVFDAYGGYAAWGGPTGYGAGKRMPDKNLLGDETGVFLYDSKDRVIADDLGSIIHWQIADLSSVAPFKYHEVRSLGFLLYAVCHLQNRLRCKLSEAVFENLMMYMRVSSLDEAERAMKVEMVNRGIIDESVKFLAPAERWQPNAQLAELGLAEYKQTIADNSSSYVQNQTLSRDRVEKTKFQVMAEVNAMQTLVSAALQMAYDYQNQEYREIFRRLLKRDSTDAGVKEFRARCLRRGIPENLLVPDAWEIEPERIVGGGNKTLEMAVAQQLMDWRPAFSGDAQQKILREAVLAITDDSAKAEELVPFAKGITTGQQNAMLAFGSLMAGGVVQFTNDQSRLETGQTLILELGTAVKMAAQMGGVGPDKLAGFQNTLQAIIRIIQELGQDRQQKPQAKKMAKVALGISKMLRKLQQMAAKQQQAGGNGKMAETQAKIQATMLQAKAKAENTRESHAQRTAQRQAQWEMEQKQKEAENAQELRFRAQEHALEVAGDTIKTHAEIANSRMKSTQEGGADDE